MELLHVSARLCQPEYHRRLVPLSNPTQIRAESWPTLHRSRLRLGCSWRLDLRIVVQISRHSRVKDSCRTCPFAGHYSPDVEQKQTSGISTQLVHQFRRSIHLRELESRNIEHCPLRTQRAHVVCI